MAGAHTAILVAAMTVTNLLIEMFFTSAMFDPFSKRLDEDANREEGTDHADSEYQTGDQAIHAFFPVSS